MAAAPTGADGPFVLNAAEAHAVAGQVAALHNSHVLDSRISAYTFTIDRANHRLIVDAPGLATATEPISAVLPHSILSFEAKIIAGQVAAQSSNPGKITGFTAIAVARALAPRTEATPSRFLVEERSNRDVIVGYEHPGTIVLYRVFPNLVTTQVSRQLDGCIPSMEFVFSKPGLHETWFRLKRCGI